MEASEVSVMNKIILRLLALLALLSNVSATRCKSLKFVGNTLTDVGSGVSTHGPNLIVFYGNDFKINVNGYLIGWTAFQNSASSKGLYLDLWRLKSTDWHIVNKKKLLTNEKRNYSVGIQEEIVVSMRVCGRGPFSENFDIFHLSKQFNVFSYGLFKC
jgi:hypothetical protein